MTLWAAVILILALFGTVTNLWFGTPVKLVLHDIMLFLVSLGMLVRIRYKSAEAEKERLKTELEKSNTTK